MPTTNIKELATSQAIGWTASGVTMVLNGAADGVTISGKVNTRTLTTDGATLDTLNTDRTNGLRGAVIKYPSRTVYAPASDTDAARGTALATALAAASSGDTIVLAPAYTYETSAGFSKSAANFFIDGRGATLKAAAGSNIDCLLYLTASTAAGRVIVDNLILDANGANVTLSSGRGETLRLDGDGECYANGITCTNGPAASTAAHYYTRGSGVKSLSNCKSINPGHVSYRLLAETSRLTNCDHFLSSTLENGRIAECDSQATPTNIKSIVWNGGLWKETASSKKRNINWDPSNDDGETADEITLANITMDFGTGHANDSDALMKFDNVHTVNVINCTQRASTIGSTFTTFTEDFINFDKVKVANVIGCRMDGGLKGAGTSEYVQVLTVQGCQVGFNAQIAHAVWNCSHFTKIVWDANVTQNLIGSGTAGLRCIFENDDSVDDQKIIVTNSHFSTNWADNMGALFRFAQKPGSVQGANNTFTDAGLATIPSFASVTRLLATAGPGDPKTLFLTRNTIGATRVGLGDHDTYNTIHPLPVKPATAGGDWFSAYTLNGVNGARIINENGGPGGNGWPMSWVCNAAGLWVAEDWGHHVDVLADADGATLTAADSKRIITNEGATGEANFILPTAAANMRFTFVCQDNSGLKVTAASGDTIRIAASVTPAAGNISTTTIGNSVTLVAINATEWVAINHEGTWTVSS